MASSSSRDQFDAHAAKYASSLLHHQGPSLPVVVAFAEPTNQDRVLDVATGTGSTALALAPLVEQVVGVDVSPKMLEQARTKASELDFHNVIFQEGAAEELPFPDASVTLVTSRHAPHHFRDARAFLREVQRVLTPGGRFILADQITPEPEVTVWVDRWERLRDPSHIQQRTASEWKTLCDEASLVWEQAQIVHYHMEFAWWVRQSGCNEATIAELQQHAQQADANVRPAMGLTFDATGQVVEHVEPILVVRLRKTAPAAG